MAAVNAFTFSAQPRGVSYTQLYDAFTFNNPNELIPPTVALVSPLTGLLVDKFTPVVLDVTDVSGFALINISIELPTGEEVVYRASTFTVGYRDTSAITNIIGGYRFTLVRKAGWPAGTVLRFNIDPVDAKGNKG